MYVILTISASSATSVRSTFFPRHPARFGPRVAASKLAAGALYSTREKERKRERQTDRQREREKGSARWTATTAARRSESRRHERDARADVRLPSGNERTATSTTAGVERDARALPKAKATHLVLSCGPSYFQHRSVSAEQETCAAATPPTTLDAERRDAAGGDGSDGGGRRRINGAVCDDAARMTISGERWATFKRPCSRTLKRGAFASALRRVEMDFN